MNSRVKSFVLLVLCFALVTVSVSPAWALSYFRARIRSNPMVFSGPGKDYYHANHGKAQYGGGVVRVYGKTCTNWIMIGYGTTNRHYRIGYVAPAMLDKLYEMPEGAEVTLLSLSSAHAELSRRAVLTDDPVVYGLEAGIVSLPKGRDVIFLANMGSWAYVEVVTKQGKMRGFVSRSAVSMSRSIPESGGENFNVQSETKYVFPTAAPQQYVTPAPTDAYADAPAAAGVPQIGSTVFYLGDKASPILWAQEKLNAIGYALTLTGTLDAYTLSALKDMRRLHGLAEAEYLDQALLDLIGSEAEWEG